MLELQTIQHSNYQTFKLSIQTIKQKHVRASNYSTFKLSIQTIKQKQSNIQTTHKSLYSAGHDDLSVSSFLPSKSYSMKFSKLPSLGGSSSDDDDDLTSSALQKPTPLTKHVEEKDLALDSSTPPRRPWCIGTPEKQFSSSVDVKQSTASKAREVSISHEPTKSEHKSPRKSSCIRKHVTSSDDNHEDSQSPEKHFPPSGMRVRTVYIEGLQYMIDRVVQTDNVSELSE